jgi:hypothetical protein
MNKEDYKFTPMPFKVPDKTWALYPSNGSYLKIELTHAPNWFHRKMQGLLLGFKYEKIKDKQRH